MLSYDGGPNHLGNLCDSPIVADKVRKSRAAKERGRTSSEVFVPCCGVGSSNREGVRAIAEKVGPVTPAVPGTNQYVPKNPKLLTPF